MENLPVFIQHQIPKRNRILEKRVVWEAGSSIIANTYKALARHLHIFFSEVLSDYPHVNSYGYTKGRNIHENAAEHTGRTYLLKTDIRNFFLSIEHKHVQKLFERFGVGQEIVKLLSSFVTIDNRLALGLATSPIISNAICLPMDKKLSALTKSYQGTKYGTVARTYWVLV